jgi:hypothetical protein
MVNPDPMLTSANVPADPGVIDWHHAMDSSHTPVMYAALSGRAADLFWGAAS